MIANDAVRIPPGPRIWSTEVAGGRMHTIVDGRAVVVPTRADLDYIQWRAQNARFGNCTRKAFAAWARNRVGSINLSEAAL